MNAIQPIRGQESLYKLYKLVYVFPNSNKIDIFVNNRLIKIQIWNRNFTRAHVAHTNVKVFYTNCKQFRVVEIVKFEFKVTIHYGLWK